MSFPNKYALSLTAEAEDDFINTLIYTTQEWGQKKREEYDALLCKALAAIKDNPFLGYRLPYYQKITDVLTYRSMWWCINLMDPISMSCGFFTNA